MPGMHAMHSLQTPPESARVFATAQTMRQCRRRQHTKIYCLINLYARVHKGSYLVAINKTGPVRDPLVPHKICSPTIPAIRGENIL